MGRLLIIIIAIVAILGILFSFTMASYAYAGVRGTEDSAKIEAVWMPGQQYEPAGIY